MSCHQYNELTQTRTLELLFVTTAKSFPRGMRWELRGENCSLDYTFLVLRGISKTAWNGFSHLFNLSSAEQLLAFKILTSFRHRDTSNIQTYFRLILWCLLHVWMFLSFHNWRKVSLFICDPITQTPHSTRNFCTLLYKEKWQN